MLAANAMLGAFASAARTNGGSMFLAMQRAMSTARSLTGPVKVGEMELKHGVVYAAMTRTRNDPVTEAPRELNAVYYEQRASEGGLLITEATQPTNLMRGYVRAPGMWTQAHFDGWKMVVDRVHKKGAYMFCQLFHPGRLSHSSLSPNGELPIAPSPIASAGQIYVEGLKKVDFEVPKAATQEDLDKALKDTVRAAKDAIHTCGFDGVEIHAANAYLLQSFTSPILNKRTDKYGGSVENRCRLLLEFVDGVAAAIGPSKTALKIQPGATFGDLIQPEAEVLEILSYLGPELSKRNLAYVCLSNLNGAPYYKYLGLSEPNIKTDLFKFFRPLYTGSLMINGGLTLESAKQYVADGTADTAAFGVAYMTNPTLPKLVAAGWGTNQINHEGWNYGIWYGRDPADDAKGYTTFPSVEP